MQPKPPAIDILLYNCNNIIAKNQQGALLSFPFWGHIQLLNKLPIPPRQEFRAAYLFYYIYLNKY